MRYLPPSLSAGNNLTRASSFVLSWLNSFINKSYARAIVVLCVDVLSISPTVRTSVGGWYRGLLKMKTIHRLFNWKCASSTVRLTSPNKQSPSMHCGLRSLQISNQKKCVAAQSTFHLSNSSCVRMCDTTPYLCHCQSSSCIICRC